MKTMKWMMGLTVYFISTLILMVASSPAAEVQDVQVGRIYYIDGELLRYVPEEDDWVAVVEDAPFGTEDTFYSGTKGMTEMIVPNGSWIRLGNNTQVQFMDLSPDLSEIDVASGVTRIYNKGEDTVIKATSPFGYVLADPGTAFDLYVGENSAEVVAVEGTVSFLHTEGGVKYSVRAGSPSIMADQDMVSAGDGATEPSWERWNDKRESFWAERSGEQGKSAEYLPPSLRYDARCLDENGKWEQVPYEGQKYWFWRPTGVSVSWSPFTMGVWTEWAGDQTWIPAEPFGYVTHHYGNWISIGDLWYWAPPVVSVRVGLPLLDIGLFWYPGRVSWIHRGVYVGWVPLGPEETYYSHRDWGGPHHRVVKDDADLSITISIDGLLNINHAVIVKQDKFHGVQDYRDVRVENVHPTIIGKYSAAPVVNNRVIKDYETNSQRHAYAKAVAQEKPHSAALDRVRYNESVINKDRKVNAEAIRQDAKGAKEGAVGKDARVESPRGAAQTGPAADAKGESVKSPKQTDARSSAGDSNGAKVQQPAKSVEQPGQVKTTSPTQQDRNVTQQGKTNQSSPTQQDRNSSQQGRSTQGPSGQQDRSVTQQGRTNQSSPTQQDRNSSQQGRSTQGTSGQQDRNVTQQGRTNQSSPTQQDRSSAQSDRTSSQNNDQQGRNSDKQGDRSGQSVSTGNSQGNTQQDVKSGSSDSQDRSQEKTSKTKSNDNKDQSSDQEEEMPMQ